MPSQPSASAQSQLPGNRKDTKTVPKGKGRQTTATSGGSSRSGAVGVVESSSARSDPYDSDQEELREDPLYLPPGKTCASLYQKL